MERLEIARHVAKDRHVCLDPDALSISPFMAAKVNNSVALLGLLPV